MSNPRYKWWGYVRAIVRAYPALDEKARELQRVSMTAAYGGTEGHVSGVHRTTESAALRQLHPTEQKELDAVRCAIDTSSAETVELIRMVFWKQTHTLSGAALALHLSYMSARRRQSDFLKRVAKKYGLL